MGLLRGLGFRGVGLSCMVHVRVRRAVHSSAYRDIFHLLLCTQYSEILSGTIERGLSI